jgi:hypothetical protein
VTVQALFRWLILEKATRSREIWERVEAAEKKSEVRLDKNEQRLKQWAMEKGKY